MKKKRTCVSSYALSVKAFRYICEHTRCCIFLDMQQEKEDAKWRKRREYAFLICAVSSLRFSCIFDNTQCCKFLDSHAGGINSENTKGDLK